MDYIFFDIECSNGHNICSFGYVITDQSFCIRQKEDIVINPQSPIVLAAHGKRPKIQLAYSEEYFKNQPTFDAFYEKIKDLLCDKNRVLFGHSISSDFAFLSIACKRYKLPPLELQGYDTQKVYQIISGGQHVQSLESIVEELKLPGEYTFHKSCDDAEATMQICKKIFQDQKLDLQSFKKMFANCLRKSGVASKNEKSKSFTQRVNELRNRYAQTQNLQKVAFSDGFKLLSASTQLKYIANLFKAGYDYTNKIKDCDIFVDDDKKGRRLQYFKYLQSTGQSKIMMSKSDFIKYLNERLALQNVESCKKKPQSVRK